MVIGVPGTGIPGGQAFAEALGLRYAQLIEDKTKQTDQRTFMHADLDSILQKVLDHFDFKAEELRGQRVCLVDDSIVRGNITTGLVRLLKEYYGVREVHIRVLSPRIDKACHFGVNTRDEQRLIARGKSVEEIRQKIGATTLAYLSAEGLKEALGGSPDAEGFCLGCMANHHPPVDGAGNVILFTDDTLPISRKLPAGAAV